MSSEHTITRPPSQLAKLASKIRKVLPQGLPPELETFYAEGDGLTVKDEGVSATIVGLRDMFDGSFKAHRPATRRLASLHTRPFDDRFMSDDFDFDAPGALDDYNRRLRLKLVCSAEGESVDFAIDLFEGEPTLYYVYRQSDVLRLDGLSFNEFVEWLTRFGTARWYYAFVELAADNQLNIDIAAAFDTSMAYFPDADLTPLRQRLAARTVALESHKKLHAEAEAKAAAHAADPANSRAVVLARVKRKAEEASYFLATFPEAGEEVMIAGIKSGELPPQTPWSFHRGLNVLPAELLPVVLESPRIRKQDDFWVRFDQLEGVTVPKGLKLSKLIKDAVAVHAFLRGEARAKVPSSVAKRMGDWLFRPTVLKEFPRAPAAGHGVRYEYERLLALGTLLVGEDVLRTQLEEAFAKSKYTGSIGYGAPLLLAARGIRLEDLGQIARKTSRREVLIELARLKGWSREDFARVAAEQGRYVDEAILWLSENL